MSRPPHYAPSTSLRPDVRLSAACGLLLALLLPAGADAQTPGQAPDAVETTAQAVPAEPPVAASEEPPAQPGEQSPTAPDLAPGNSGEEFAEQFGQVLREAMPAVAEVDVDGPAYEITGFDIYYREPGDDLPPIESILPITVELQASPTGFIRPRQDGEHQTVRIDTAEGPPVLFHASAIGTIARQLLADMHGRDLLGVYVQPSHEDIDITSERDLRPAGDRRLRIGIWIGRIKDVRTIAAGERIKGDWRVDNPAHRRIRSYSPLHPPTAGHEQTTDLLRKDELEDYLFLLNRHPGRHVEAALAASEDEEGISLDYRVYESKPWSVYAQVANSGTDATGLWQTRVGFINRQLTNRDDIFSVEYLNAGLTNVHSVNASYDAPWFAPKRPHWMETSGKEPPWLGWADRSMIPWWGLGRLRWRVGGGWTQIQPESVVQLPNSSFLIDQVTSSDWNAYGRLTYNVFQHRAIFLDLFAEGRFRGVSVDNTLVGNQGDVTLFLMDLGFQAERVNQFSALHARFSGERALTIGYGQDAALAFASGLGRARTDSSWWDLKWDVGASYYLEPLVNRDAWLDASSAMSSTLSHEVAVSFRGQYAFDYRLIPQSSQVIGGAYSVRGFPQGLAVGDSVYLGSAEYRFHIPRMLPIKRRPMSLPWIGDFRATPQQVYGRPDWDLVLRAFVDAGSSVRNRRQISTGTELNQTLVGAGVGVEFIFKGKIRARVDWGRGIYKSTGCDVVVPSGGNPASAFVVDSGCAIAKYYDPIDSSGQVYFLFSVMY